jgi:hypothetical protein
VRIVHVAYSRPLIYLFRYFTKDGQHGVCVFRRRKTTEQGHRGFRLSSLGILLAKSRRPRPWRHVQALKDLTTIIYSRLEESGILDPTDSDWEPARAFFGERKLRRADLGGAGDWNGWSYELDGVRVRLPLRLNRRLMRIRAPTHPMPTQPYISRISFEFLGLHR